jgi:hypothetical protein
MRTKWPLLLLLVSTGVMAGAGCAHKSAERREPRVVEGPPRGDWVRLGERWVDGTHDRDVIPVGAREGRYRQIMFVVEHSALEMYDVIVTFGDGERFSPRTRHVFGAETRSSVIDLPGAARVIRSVEFRYGNLPGGGKARLELLAK